jgi:hypothetical protein
MPIPNHKPPFFPSALCLQVWTISSTSRSYAIAAMCAMLASSYTSTDGSGVQHRRDLDCQRGLYALRQLGSSGSPRPTDPESHYDGGHNVQDLSVSCLRHVTTVVAQNGVEKRRDKVAIDHVQVLRALDVCLVKPEDLLLDGPELADLGSLSRELTWAKHVRGFTGGQVIGAYRQMPQSR